MEYTLIRNGQVVNVIVADSAFIDLIRDQYDEVLENEVLVHPPVMNYDVDLNAEPVFYPAINCGGLLAPITPDEQQMIDAGTTDEYLLTKSRLQAAGATQSQELEMRGTYMAIVGDANSFSIQEFPVGTRPSNYIAPAPPGFSPGDENALSVDANTRQVSIIYNIVRDRLANQTWNSQTPLQRFLGALKA